MSQYRKSTGYRGEEIVQSFYEDKWFRCVVKNFTMRWGELDLVLENAHECIVVEVKVVNYLENLHDYITASKLQALQRTIQTYFWKYPTDKLVRLDVVFVKWSDIVEIFEAIEV